MIKRSTLYLLLCGGTLFLVNNIYSDAAGEFNALQARWKQLSAKTLHLPQMVTDFISHHWNEISEGKKAGSNTKYVQLKNFFDEYNAFGNDCRNFFNKFKAFSISSASFKKMVNDLIVFNRTKLYMINKQLTTQSSTKLFKATGISGYDIKLAEAIDGWRDIIKLQTENWNNFGLAFAPTVLKK